MSTRTTAASTLFAHDPAYIAIITAKVGTHTIGRWRRVVGQMFRELPQEKQDTYHRQAKELKEAVNNTVDVWFAYVSQ